MSTQELGAFKTPIHFDRHADVGTGTIHAMPVHFEVGADVRAHSEHHRISSQVGQRRGWSRWPSRREEVAQPGKSAKVYAPQQDESDVPQPRAGLSICATKSPDFDGLGVHIGGIEVMNRPSAQRL